MSEGTPYLVERAFCAIKCQFVAYIHRKLISTRGQDGQCFSRLLEQCVILV